MKVATLSTKGQITIPKDIQKLMSVTYGSKLLLYPNKNMLMVKPLKTSLGEQTAGSLKKYAAKDTLGVPFSEVRKTTQELIARELGKKYE